MSLHKGHLSLVEFAASKCDLLYVVICYTGRTAQGLMKNREIN